MVTLKYFCTVIAVIATCLYVSNIITDVGSALTWRTSLTLDGEDPTYNEDISKTYSLFRLILSIIMGLSWGAVLVI